MRACFHIKQIALQHLWKQPGQKTKGILVNWQVIQSWEELLTPWKAEKPSRESLDKLESWSTPSCMYEV